MLHADGPVDGLGSSCLSVEDHSSRRHENPEVQVPKVAGEAESPLVSVDGPLVCSPGFWGRAAGADKGAMAEPSCGSVPEVLADSGEKPGEHAANSVDAPERTNAPSTTSAATAHVVALGSQDVGVSLSPDVVMASLAVVVEMGVRVKPMVRQHSAPWLRQSNSCSHHLRSQKG